MSLVCLVWEVDLEAEAKELFDRRDGDVSEAIKVWRYVHPEIRRRAIQNIECGDPVETYSHERARGREALIALPEALE